MIDNARNANELDSVFRLVGVIFPPQPDGESEYTRELWVQSLGERPESLLYVRDGDVICGSVFAWTEGNGSVTISRKVRSAAVRERGMRLSLDG